jgi:hypothetical protein
MRRQSRFPAFILVRHLGGSIPAGGDTESSAREFNFFSRNLEVGGQGQLPWQLPDIWKLPVIR